jgi:peptidoglycan biosynthesis protein MviN/MurJ (putative lipid II flippase)
MFGMRRDEEGSLSVGKIIGVVILVIIGLLMLPIVQDAVYNAQENENTTDTQSTLLDMVTVFYVLGITLAAVMWVVHETKGFGGG